MSGSIVVLAPDGFKGSIGAASACDALAEGWRAAAPDARIVSRPMADGGEGTLQALARAVPGPEWIPVTVTGPAGAATSATWLRLPPTQGMPGGTGVVELASTSGIELLGSRLAPWDADTTGFGEAIASALDAGVSRLVLAIGSSGSTDAAAGMLTALGARFRDVDGGVPPPGARGLLEIETVQLDGLRSVPVGGVTVLTDVRAPLLGPRGAAAVFGPQKGLRADEIPVVDAALDRFAQRVRIAAPAADPAAPGAGAAGGTGFALLAWGARLVDGAAEIAALAGVPDALTAASVVITGEGRFDRHSTTGKAPGHVAALAQKAGVPAILVAGTIAADADTSGFAAAVSLAELAGDSRAARADPARWLRAAGERAASLIGR